MNKLKNAVTYISALLVLCIILFSGCSKDNTKGINNDKNISAVSLSDIPSFQGEAYVSVNGNKPNFSKDEITDKSFEHYSELDEYGRCSVAMASVGRDIMPEEKRGSISSVKPSGWQSVTYDFIDQKSLYNRCHLLGFQLTGENANKKNLITGTRYMNVEGMLPFEDMVADYVKETNNHVMYRVTPIFKDRELVARGVLMEGYSVEDKGKSISFHVYCYNVQPGIEIDYATGNSRKIEKEDYTKESGSTTESTESDKTYSNNETEYILNLNTHKFHLPNCSGVSNMSEENKEKFYGTRDEVIGKGYEPCRICNP